MQKKLLLVEDDVLQQAKIKSYVEQMGYDVICCEDGSEALYIVNERYREIAIIVMDFFMPNVDGLTALSQLKRDGKTRAIPVIMMSADDIREYVIGCEFLRKPFSKEQLKFILDQYEFCKPDL
jgi:CheY-like chemotaxis protein